MASRHPKKEERRLGQVLRSQLTLYGKDMVPGSWFDETWLLGITQYENSNFFLSNKNSLQFQVIRGYLM